MIVFRYVFSPREHSKFSICLIDQTGPPLMYIQNSLMHRTYLPLENLLSFHTIIHEILWCHKRPLAPTLGGRRAVQFVDSGSKEVSGAVVVRDVLLKRARQRRSTKKGRCQESSMMLPKLKHFRAGVTNST